MPPAAAPLNTPQVFPTRYLDSFPLKAATRIFAGTLVAVDAEGLAQPASDSADLLVKGRAAQTVDNRDGDDGDLRVTVDLGVFRYAQTGTPITRAGFPANPVAFVADDQTVSADAGDHEVVAGLIYDVSDDGVWVDQNHLALALARHLATDPAPEPES